MTPDGPADGSAERAEALYGLPLEEFTAARNALAKELSRAGDKAAAERVKRLPKPSRTAWALNQLARQRPEDVGRLLDAGRAVREAQERALAGDAGGLRAASRAEQEQVDRLLDAAVGVLGGTADHDRIRRTLRSAATDPATGDLMRSGRLVSDVEVSGFGLEGLTFTDAPGPGPRPVPEPGPAEAREKDEQAAAGAERARRRAEHRKAAKEAERLGKEAEVARRRAERLADTAERAERHAAEARRDADAAAADAAEAVRRAEDAAARADELDWR